MFGERVLFHLDDEVVILVETPAFLGDAAV
jgi:hypothetical protein